MPENNQNFICVADGSAAVFSNGSILYWLFNSGIQFSLRTLNGSDTAVMPAVEK